MQSTPFTVDQIGTLGACFDMRFSDGRWTLLGHRLHIAEGPQGVSEWQTVAQKACAVVEDTDAAPQFAMSAEK